MQPLKDAIGPLLARLQAVRPYREAQVMDSWPAIVGALVADKTAPVELRGATLFVRTASSAWMAELTAGFRHLYVEAYQARLGPDVVTDIRFLPPPLPKRRAGPKGAPEAPVAHAPHPTAEELEAGSRAVAGVTDDRVRALLGRVVATQKALQRTRAERGWVPCPSCQGLQEEQGLCSVCRNQRDSEIDRRISGVLVAAPWSTALDVRALLPGVRVDRYSRVKGALLARLHAVLRAWDKTRPGREPFPRSLALLALRYAMLRTGRRPHELGDVDLQRALGPLHARYPKAGEPARGARPPRGR